MTTPSLVPAASEIVSRSASTPHSDFTEDGLYVGMMPGLRKALDLRRDPRLALHCPTEDPPPDDPGSGRGDAKIAGRAIELTDPADVKEAHRFLSDSTAPGRALDLAAAVAADAQMDFRHRRAAMHLCDGSVCAAGRNTRSHSVRRHRVAVAGVSRLDGGRQRPQQRAVARYLGDPSCVVTTGQPEGT
jgi:hypothetical protein